MPSGYYNDWGFCGTSDFYHWDITSDPRFLTDPKWQLEKCLELFEAGTTFYGKNRLKNDAKFNAETEAQFILK